MNKRINSKLVLLSILLPLFLVPVILPVVNAYTVPDSNSGSSPVYLMTGDLIKNTKFVSIGKTSIALGGSAYDNRLKFEISPLWKMERDDIELIYTHTVGNKVYLYYKMPLTADINIYTNCRYVDVCEYQTQATEKYTAVTYHHFLLFDNEKTADYWKKYINSYSWDFGNVRDYNSKNNVYSGVVKINFDIKQSPFPASLTDEEGNTLKKEFDYIGVSSAAVLSSDKGFLSQASPDIMYSVPQEDKSSEQKQVSSDPSLGPMIQSNDNIQYRSNAIISDAGVDTWDAGIQMPSGDSNLNPTRADGGPIYDNTMENETSQKDCSLYYNLGSLTPVVTEYFGKLTYNTLNLRAHDEVFGNKIYQDPGVGSADLSTAIHVSNRYVHSQIQVVLNVWSSYEIQVLDPATSEDYNLEKPLEYYDNLTWRVATDGLETMEYEEPDSGLGLDALGKSLNGFLDLIGQVLIYLIIVVIIVVAIYITYKVVIAKRSTEYVATRVIRG